MSTKTLIATIFDHKSWANDALFAALKALPQNSPDMEAALRTLNHVYVVDQIFRANLQRQPHHFTSLNTPETPSVAALCDGVSALDAWYRPYIASLPDDSFEEQIPFTFANGASGCMTRGEMLFHVALHGGYHRGAVGKLLPQIYDTASRDTLTVYLHERDLEVAG